MADVLICRKGRDVQPLQCLAHRGERRAAMPNHVEEMVGKMGNSTYNCEYIFMYVYIYIYIYAYIDVRVCIYVLLYAFIFCFLLYIYICVIVKGDMLKPNMNPKSTSSCVESFGGGHREALQTRKTHTLRYVDIYTLGASMPEETLLRRPADVGMWKSQFSDLFFSAMWHPHIQPSDTKTFDGQYFYLEPPTSLPGHYHKDSTLECHLWFHCFKSPGRCRATERRSFSFGPGKLS